ncbi:hypothetical protein AVEN_157504-1 [Araneus ventricosus]|uniref:Uncharacterized protein n=1 Tax=Araneus ventricosus TaxID=182803 RepID=A0A4Y2GWM2_ARAVE|nr:hypothetical protein AVEN_157504-1 [Araneus ventricosus]
MWDFLQQQRDSTAAVALLVSSGVWHIRSSAVVVILASRSTSSTGVLIPLVMVPQPMGDTTMHIQLSGNSRLSCTSLQHTNSPLTHLIVQMVSSTHVFRFGYIGCRGTIAACELKHRSGKPLFKTLSYEFDGRHCVIDKCREKQRVLHLSGENCTCTLAESSRNKVTQRNVGHISAGEER